MSPDMKELLQVVCREGRLQCSDGRLAIVRDSPDSQYRVLDEPLANVTGARGHVFVGEDGETVERAEVHIAFAAEGVRYDMTELGSEPLVLETTEEELPKLSALLGEAKEARRALWSRRLLWPDLRPPQDPSRPDLIDALQRATGPELSGQVFREFAAALRPDERVLEFVAEKSTWTLLTTWRILQVNSGRLSNSLRELPLFAVQGVISPAPQARGKQLVLDDGVENHVIVADGPKDDVARGAEALRMMLDLLSRDGEPLLPPWNSARLCEQFDALCRDLELGVMDREIAERRAESLAIALDF